MKWDELKEKITFSNVLLCGIAILMFFVIYNMAMLMAGTGETIAWDISREGTVENVTVIGVDSLFHDDEDYSPASIRCRVILRDEPLAVLSEADYYAVMNRDLPVNCTMRFGKGDELDTILSFENETNRRV